MARRIQLSAVQYMGLTLLGSLLLASGLVLNVPIDHWLANGGWLSRLLVFLPFFGVGITLMSVAEFRFRNGVRSGRWSEEDIVPLRMVIQSPWWLAGAFAVLIVSAILMLVVSHRYRSIGWAVLIVGQSLICLRLAFLQQIPKSLSPRVPWRRFPPIQSDHWGER